MLDLSNGNAVAASLQSSNKGTSLAVRTPHVTAWAHLAFLNIATTAMATDCLHNYAIITQEILLISEPTSESPEGQVP